MCKSTLQIIIFCVIFRFIFLTFQKEIVLISPRSSSTSSQILRLLQQPGLINSCYEWQWYKFHYIQITIFQKEFQCPMCIVLFHIMNFTKCFHYKLWSQVYYDFLLHFNSLLSLMLIFCWILVFSYFPNKYCKSPLFKN